MSFPTVPKFLPKTHFRATIPILKFDFFKELEKVPSSKISKLLNLFVIFNRIYVDISLHLKFQVTYKLCIWQLWDLVCRYIVRPRCSRLLCMCFRQIRKLVRISGNQLQHPIKLRGRRQINNFRYPFYIHKEFIWLCTNRVQN